MTTIQNNNDLLNYLITQSETGKKDWFGFPQQKILTMNLAYEIAKNHANHLSPEQVVDYVLDLNNNIFKKIVIRNLN
jgi:hypothetical protein